MHEIQNKRGIQFAGAYLRYGFHEDGFTTGLQAAARLGVKAPFDIEVHHQKVTHLWPAYFFELFELRRSERVGSSDDGYDIDARRKLTHHFNVHLHQGMTSRKNEIQQGVNSVIPKAEITFQQKSTNDNVYL